MHTSFWISLGMSVVLFLIGMTFLAIALARAMAESTVSTSTLTIAGIGLADFILLFYTRPWKDISTNLASSQRVKMIAISYFSSFQLIREGREKEFQMLEQLTRSSLGYLEKYIPVDEPAEKE